MKIHILALAALVSAGCYNPTFKPQIACGAGDTCPPGTSCGTDGKCHDATSQLPDAPLEQDASIDARPVACAADGDCATPPDLCSKAGTCDLSKHNCVFPAVICSEVGDDCNRVACQPATGACIKIPTNQDQACGTDGTVCVDISSCSATSGACGNGMKFQKCTSHTCQAGTCSAKDTTDSTTCSTDGVSCGTAVISCDDTRCTGTPNGTCAGTEPCTETDQVCSNQVCTTAMKPAAPRSCTEPNGTTCSPTTNTCGSCDKDSSPTSCSEAGHLSCTQTTFSCQNGSCPGTGVPFQGPACTVNTDGNPCTVRCMNGSMECTCGNGVCGNCGPCTT